MGAKRRLGNREKIPLASLPQLPQGRGEAHPSSGTRCSICRHNPAKRHHTTTTDRKYSLLCWVLVCPSSHSVWWMCQTPRAHRATPPVPYLLNTAFSHPQKCLLAPASSTLPRLRAGGTALPTSIASLKTKRGKEQKERSRHSQHRQAHPAP